ncbi:MAG: 3-deoxy-D-manno-octulosonic acid transferase [Alistipes sp.]|nr:3-deoxy-D-manno-octulosonic acid transferase [Alistipes sp.]
MGLYNIGIALYDFAIGMAARRNPKARQWKEGRRGIFDKMRSAISPDDRVVWVHSASLGEFEQGRPIIEKIKEQYPDYKILLTFFSPSGYEIRKNYPKADYIFYLPSDKPSNVRRFLDIAHPEAVIFIKYEFWLNYLGELRKRKIPTYIVSAIFRRQSIFFRFYGRAWRKALETFSTLFVQNEESKQLLATIGRDNAVVAGDTRFDRVADIAHAARRIPLIEAFKGESRLFVAGSTWGPDEDILQEIINDNPDIRFVVAPHEMDEQRIRRIIDNTRGGAVRYTQCDEASDFSHVQVLILDTVGILSSVYGYASWSYIGGGFGVGIHNTLEAATFGLPIAFGPNYAKFKEARDMIGLGAARSIASAAELKEWFAPLRDDEAARLHISRLAADYTQSNCGATEMIVDAVFKSRQH